MPKSLVESFRNQRGATLLVVLVMLVVLGLALGMTGRLTSSIMQQVKEEELLFRGDQYRRAIESYARVGQGNLQAPQVRAGSSPGRIGAAAGGANYPAKLEDLLRDPRSPGKVRHIRRLYKDPFTGEDFVIVKDPGGRIKGVRSAGEDEPFKQDNFPPEYENFKGAKAYKDWEFVFEPGQAKSTNSTAGATIQGLEGVRSLDDSNPASTSPTHSMPSRPGRSRGFGK